MFLIPNQENADSLRVLMENYGPVMSLFGQLDKWPILRFTTAETFMDLSKIERLEAVELLKKMKRAKLGRFITGRRGGSTRIEWRYNPKKLHAMIVAEQATIENQSAEPIDSGRLVAVIESTEYKFPLRKDYELTLSLPKNLNSKDTQRLSDWLRTLALD